MEFEKSDLKFYGNYRGKVLYNNDPNKLGRIKVEIFGICDGVDYSNLPWATPAMPIGVGAGSGYGNLSIPEVDSLVWCFFEAGDFEQPVYFAEAFDGVHGIFDEQETNYPYRRIMKTKNGIIIYINDQSSDKEIKIEHPGGASIKIDNGGNIEIVGTTVHINPS